MTSSRNDGSGTLSPNRLYEASRIKLLIEGTGDKGLKFALPADKQTDHIPIADSQAGRSAQLALQAALEEMRPHLQAALAPDYESPAEKAKREEVEAKREYERSVPQRMKEEPPADGHFLSHGLAGSDGTRERSIHDEISDAIAESQRLETSAPLMLLRDRYPKNAEIGAELDKFRAIVTPLFEISIHEEAKPRSRVVCPLTPGESAIVLEEAGAYYYVRVKKGKNHFVGWARKDDVEVTREARYK